MRARSAAAPPKERRDEVRKQMGFCMQQNVLWDTLTVEERPRDACRGGGAVAPPRRIGRAMQVRMPVRVHMPPPEEYSPPRAWGRVLAEVDSIGGEPGRGHRRRRATIQSLGCLAAQQPPWVSV